jgi:hypothetical protein
LIGLTKDKRSSSFANRYKGPFRGAGVEKDTGLSPRGYTDSAAFQIQSGRSRWEQGQNGVMGDLGRIEECPNKNCERIASEEMMPVMDWKVNCLMSA